LRLLDDDASILLMYDELRDEEHAHAVLICERLQQLFSELRELAAA
jgi:hypothetical protein